MNPSQGGSSQAARPPAQIQMPAFLQSSRADIHNKFVDLEWQQRNRLAPTDANARSSFARLTGEKIAPLNRYVNIDPYSRNRVKLKVPEGANDYINASPIVLTHSKSGKARRYIATQGPTELSLGHVWRMIWHETGPVAVIIMLTQTHESGREKCFQYFPVDPSSPTLQVNAHDEFRDGEVATVTLLESHYDERARSTVRKLRMQLGRAQKTVYHLLFAAWPDFLVPEGEDRAALLELVRLSGRLNREGSQGDPRGEEANPRIVHCSAGVGRSGTFIALDYLLGELEEGAMERVPEEEDPVVGTVDVLRRQRMMMVQGENQMKFLYDVLRELWVKRYQGGAKV